MDITVINEKVAALFNDFITKLLTDQNFANTAKGDKYVYAHNLSGFDGVLFPAGRHRPAAEKRLRLLRGGAAAPA